MKRMTARTALKNHGRRYDESGEHLLKEDMEVLRNKKVRLSSVEKTGIASFLEGPAERNDVFHMALSPVPYLGNLESADTFLLMLNPSLGAADYATDAQPDFQAVLRKTRLQELEDETHQCFALNPRYASTSWFIYYEKLFRKALWGHVNASQEPITYAKALKGLADRLAILELVPYYSGRSTQVTVARSKLLPSAKLARAAAQEVAEEAAEGRALVLLRWGASIWNLQGGKVESPESTYGFSEFEKEVVVRLNTPHVAKQNSTVGKV